VWWWAIGWALTASGAVPEGVRPVTVPEEMPARFEVSAASMGLAGATLPCVKVAPEAVVLCFRVREGETQRWVDSRDLAAWGTDLPGLVEAVRARAPAQLAGSGAMRAVAGMDAEYWLGAEGTGWESAVWLVPGWFEARLATARLLVAAPSLDVMVAWAGGHPELDRIMAVGVHEMHGKQAHPVSPWVFRWEEGAWQVYGRAVPTPPKGSPTRLP
jgi:hypothetical protein